MKQIFAHPHQMESTDFGWPRNFLQKGTNSDSPLTIFNSTSSTEPKFQIIKHAETDPTSGLQYQGDHIHIPEIVMDNQEVLMQINIDPNTDKPIMGGPSSLTVSGATDAWGTCYSVQDENGRYYPLWIYKESLYDMIENSNSSLDSAYNWCLNTGVESRSSTYGYKIDGEIYSGSVSNSFYAYLRRITNLDFFALNISNIASNRFYYLGGMPQTSSSSVQSLDQQRLLKDLYLYLYYTGTYRNSPYLSGTSVSSVITSLGDATFSVISPISYFGIVDYALKLTCVEVVNWDWLKGANNDGYGYADSYENVISAGIKSKTWVNILS